MDKHNAESALPPNEESSDFTVIGSYHSARAAHEAGLSVLACGHHYWIHATDGQYLLIVPREHEQNLRKEVEIATFLNRYWPPVSLDLPTRPISKLPTGFFVTLLVIVFSLQNVSPELRELGANNSQGVLLYGEWWRVLTAVTLHANVGHLAGNILGLSFFGHLCCRYMGNGLAWMLILSTAALSNLTNVFLNAGHVYVSLGASTAVFSALGLLTGFPVGCFLRSRDPIPSRDWLIPFFGGCILFAWIGGGDFPTDVPAHLWSFAYGLFASVAIARSAVHAKLESKQQGTLLTLVVATLGASWIWALLYR